MEKASPTNMLVCRNSWENKCYGTLFTRWRTFRSSRAALKIEFSWVFLGLERSECVMMKERRPTKGNHYVWFVKWRGRWRNGNRGQLERKSTNQWCSKGSLNLTKANWGALFSISSIFELADVSGSRFICFGLPWQQINVSPWTPWSGKKRPPAESRICHESTARQEKKADDSLWFHLNSIRSQSLWWGLSSHSLTTHTVRHAHI